MSELVLRSDLACPYTLAKIFLEQELGPVADAARPESLTLKSPISHIPLEPAAEVEFSVAIGKDLKHHDQPWLVSWQPKAHGLFPAFSGTLAVRRRSLHKAALELRGVYKPPFGAAGKAFDLALGKRIAETTGKHLLNTFASKIESAFTERQEAQSTNVRN